MSIIKYNVNGSYPPFGVELRKNNITGQVVENKVIETIGQYQFNNVIDGDYVIVIYDTVGGRTNSNIITITS